MSLLLFYGVRACSALILAAVQFPQHHLLKRLSLLHCIFLPPHRLVDCRRVGLFLGFLSCFIDLYVCFCKSIILFWWLSPCSIVWSQGTWFLQLHFFFPQDCFGYLGVSCASEKNLKTFCSSSVKNVTGNLTEITLSL